MNEIIKIEKITQRIEFAISLLDSLFTYNEKIKIHIYCKVYNQDKKIINKFNKSPFILRLLFNHYTFIFNRDDFNNIKSMLYKYFAYNWDYIINNNHGASFKYNKNELVIYHPIDEKEQVERILNKFVYDKIITSYENVL